MPRRIAPAVAVLLAALVAGGSLAPGRFGPAAARQASPAASPAAACPATTPEENAALVRRWHEEAWGRGNLEVLDEVLADDYVAHVPGLAAWLPAAQVRGADRTVVAETLRGLRTDFPDLRVTVEAMVAEGDTVAARLTYAGTQADPLDTWSSPDTGRRMARETWVFARVACGRIVEEWVLFDNLTMLRQLGVVTDEELADAGTPTVATPAP